MKRIDEHGRSCTKCKIYKPWEEYSRDAKGENQKRADCTTCRRKLAREKYHEKKLADTED